jgi:hypothetical protein
MTNNHDQPHGFGRAIVSNNDFWVDGQFINGKKNGYIRGINS